MTKYMTTFMRKLMNRIELPPTKLDRRTYLRSASRLQTSRHCADQRQSSHNKFANEPYLCASPSPKLETPVFQGASNSPPYSPLLEIKTQRL